MSGRELFESMSYVDERFVAEAESASLPGKTGLSWRKWVPAACVGILLFGAAAYQGMNTGSGESLRSEDQVYSTEEVETQTEPGPQEEIQMESFQKAASVILRVDTPTEEGFVGTVWELVDTEIFHVGMEVNVVLAEDCLAVSRENASIMTDQAEQKDCETAQSVLVLVRFSSFDPESNTLYVMFISEVEE